MERRKFTREFKLEAVRLIKERSVSYAQASHGLIVHQSQSSLGTLIERRSSSKTTCRLCTQSRATIRSRKTVARVMPLDRVDPSLHRLGK
jgi:transposase-like protein